MPTPKSDPTTYETGVARSALVTGLIGIVLMAIYMVTPVGPFVLYRGMLFGLVGLILGIVALTKRQPKGMAVTGLITGAVAFFFGFAVVLFALLFIGAFSA